jgi:hypothetical protein
VSHPAACGMRTTTGTYSRVRNFTCERLSERPGQRCNRQWREWHYVSDCVVQGTCSYQDNCSSYARHCGRLGTQRPATLCSKFQTSRPHSDRHRSQGQPHGECSQTDRHRDSAWFTKVFNNYLADEPSAQRGDGRRCLGSQTSRRKGLHYLWYRRQPEMVPD